MSVPLPSHCAPPCHCAPHHATVPCPRHCALPLSPCPPASARSQRLLAVGAGEALRTPCCQGGCVAPGVSPGAGQACPHLTWARTRAAGTVWVSLPGHTPMHPPGKTHPCSDPLLFLPSGQPGRPGTRRTSGKEPPRTMCRGGLCWPAAPSSSCATSQHCPDRASPCLPQGSAGPPGTQGPAGTKVQHQHRHIQPGRGKPCLARYGRWREDNVSRHFGMEGEMFQAGSPPRSSRPWGRAGTQPWWRWLAGGGGGTEAGSLFTGRSRGAWLQHPGKHLHPPHQHLPGPLKPSDPPGAGQPCCRTPSCRGSQGPSCASAVPCPFSDMALPIAGLAWSPGQRGAARPPWPPRPWGKYLQCHQSAF